MYYIPDPPFLLHAILETALTHLRIDYANFSHVTCIHSQIFFHRKCKNIEQNSIKNRNKIYFNEKSWNLLLFIFWKIQINSNENSTRKLIISTQSVMCSTSFVSVYWSWNTHTCQVVCNLGMNFMHLSWKGDSPLWILCVSWCQKERAARFRLRLGNLLHLHAIRDSKTWNDSDKTSMTAGNYNSLMTGKFFLFMASSFIWKTLIAFKMIAFSFVPHSHFDKPKTLNYIE